MKKFIFALCFNHLVYADGFADLKQIQDRFYEHIYRAGSELGAEHAASVSAPEVAYVAGLLQLPPVTLRGSDEANAIYMSLRKKGESRNVGGSPCDYPPNAQASAAFNASDFSALTRYNKYSETGHSVLGVAAQEKVVLRFAALPPMAAAPAPAAVAVPGALPNMAGILGGFGGFKNTGIKPPEGGTAAAVAPVAVPLLVKVQQKIAELTIKDPKTKDENTDLTLLQELEQKLGVSPAAGTSVEDAARLEKLKTLFANMSIEDSSKRDMAMGALLMGLMKKVGGSAAPVAAPAPATPASMTLEEIKAELTKVDAELVRLRGLMDSDPIIATAKRRVLEIGEQIKDLREKPDKKDAVAQLKIDQEIARTEVDRLFLTNSNSEVIKKLEAQETALSNQIFALEQARRRAIILNEDSEGSDDEAPKASVTHKLRPAASSPAAVANIPSMLLPPSPVPPQGVATAAFAQAVATAAPAFDSTSTVAAADPSIAQSQKGSPQPARGYVPGAFQGFSPKPSVVSGVGGSAKKAVAAPSSPMPVISSASATAAPAPAADGAATAPTPTSSSASVAVGGGALPPIDVWAEQEFERRKAEIEHQIEALNSEDVNALKASLRMARRTEINALLKPLEAELARYNNSYAQGSIIAEIKRSYPR